MIIILAVTVLVLIWMWCDTRKPYKFPPGPRWLPLLGNLVYLWRRLSVLHYHHLVWRELSHHYGSLVGLRLGRDRVVLVSGHDAVREVCRREEFDGRPEGFFFRLRTFGQRLGVVFTDGAFWAEHRRFSMRHLRSLGLGRSIMDQLLQEESEGIITQLRSKAMEGPVEMHTAFDVPVLNVLWAMMAGKRFDLNDKRLLRLFDLVHGSFRMLDMSGGLLNELPMLRHIVPGWLGYTQIKNTLQGLYGFLKETVDEHKATYSEGKIRDFIDAFIHEMKNNETESFTDQQLLSLCLDLFQAGSETTSNTLGFAVLYVILYPEIQKEIHSELDRVVGRKRAPTLQDRTSLHYIMAVLMEVQRIGSIAPVSVGHRAMKDSELMGHHIPQGTIILLSLHSLHNDPDYWKDPQSFRPERFLRSDGEGTIMPIDEHLAPFGLGKRRCLGEALARSSLFVFFARLLHAFELRAVDGEPPDSRGLDGVTLAPRRFRAHLIQRF